MSYTNSPMKNGVKSFATIVKYEFMQHPVYIQKGPKSFITNGGQLRFKFFLIKSFFWFITKLYLFCHQRSTILVTMGQYAHFCTYRLDDHRLTDGRTNGRMHCGLKCALGGSLGINIIFFPLHCSL